ncbi:unnamed protein product [Urochloa decumbens]|uniref:CUE domain-containing protein n=1 Tax=Urochloa decumbens TaxID=240449 RepID=A0ABC8YWD7_9POAL
MAFKQVFYALREVFPQIDLRILKAVASQYSSDVDAAVEFVLSDVLPAVSEPTEAHYTLEVIDYARDDHTNSFSNGNFHERPVSPGYYGLRYNKLEECSLIKDKAVINETITTPVVHYDQVEASSASASKPPTMEYEQSASTTFVNQFAMEKRKTTPQAENVANQKHFNSNYKLPNFLASSGSILPLYTESPSDCAVKYKGQSPLKLPGAGSTQNFKSQDKYNLESLFASFCQPEDEHASVNSLGDLTVHTLCASGDNDDLHALFEKEMPLKLCEAETVSHLSKSEDNCNLDTLFAGFSSNEDRETSHSMPNVPTFQTLPESEGYYTQVLFEKGKLLDVSATQRTLDISKSEDNYKFQDMFENVDNVGKQLYMLHSEESTPGLRKSEDGLYKKSCASDSNTQVPIFLRKDENNKSSCKIDDQCTLPDLFVSSKLVNHSSQIFEKKDRSCADGSEEQPSMLPEPFSSLRNVSLSNLVLKCEVRNGAEKKVMCSNIVDKHSVVPFTVHDTFRHNEIKLMPGPDKYENFLVTNTKLYQIAGINELLSDITDSKEELSSLYDSTTIKTKEVELMEGSSRKAKQDAVKVHQDSVAMVEKINWLIENAKESNYKQAQIVQEEKSLLAALAQDLHSRLTKLSVERDEAFTIVEEIKLELDVRLATSIEEEAAAREQISQEEKLGLLVRKEKEVELGSITEESRKLQKEAEENLLLRCFLSDCGRTIDILQGEISSIHEKLIALKERTHGSRFQSALVATEKAVTSSLVPDCKIALPDRHFPLKNQNNNDLKQEKMVGSHAKDHEEFSDEEWEMLESGDNSSTELELARDE